MPYWGEGLLELHQCGVVPSQQDRETSWGSGCGLGSRGVSQETCMWGEGFMRGCQRVITRLLEGSTNVKDWALALTRLRV